MKIIILTFILISATSHAQECKLTGELQSGSAIETSFSAQNLEECQELASNTANNKFFGLALDSDPLIETKLKFKAAEITEDSVIFN